MNYQELLEKRLENLNSEQKDLLTEALNRFDDEKKKLILKLVEIANPAQLEAILHSHEKEGPLLILAGAGSGKTAVLTRRIVYLLLMGVPASNILAVTFTTKAAGEMKQRVKHLLEQLKNYTDKDDIKKEIDEFIEKTNEMWVSTFHSACLKILREEFSAGYGEKFGYSSRVKVADYKKIMNILDNVLGFKTGLKTTLKAFARQNIADIYEKICRAKEELLDEKTFKKKAETELEKIAAEAFPFFNREMQKLNLIDFSDMLYLTNKLFDQFPEVLKKWQKQFEYILIDEYQDTNHAQYQITKKLVGNRPNLFVVGDDDQSIYGWRGADIRNILNFKNDFPDCKIIKLEINYRSTEKILKVANEIFKDKPPELRKILKINPDNPEAVYEKSADIKFYKALTEEDELNYITNEIKNLIKSGKYKYKDIAVFYRINRQSHIVMKKFEKEEIPFRVVGAERAILTPEVMLILNLIEFTLTKDDEEKMYNLMRYPEFGLTARETANIQHLLLEPEERCKIVISLGREKPPSQPRLAGEYRTLKERLAPETKSKIKSFVSLIDKIENILKSGEIHTGIISEAVEFIIEKLKLLEKLEKSKKEKEIKMLESFVDIIKSDEKEFFTGKTYPENIVEFLDEFKAKISEPDFETEKGKDQVSLMTLHSSKGLEFPVVFFMAVEEGIVPYFHPVEKLKGKRLKERIEEEKRLFYVGITRAKERLYISYAKERNWFGKKVFLKPSRFLKLLPDEPLKKEKTKEPFIKAFFRTLKFVWRKLKGLIFLLILILLFYLFEKKFSLIEKIGEVIRPYLEKFLY